MKTNFLLNWQKSIRVMYHFFAITGVISSLFFIVSWSEGKVNAFESSKVIPGKSPDTNVATETAKAFITDYSRRFVKGEVPPKGYFVSRAAISWLLEDVSLNGIYVYPAVNGQGVVCAIVEGGTSPNASHNVVEGIAGRVVMTDSPCPTDCGSLMR
jgi:hypothetical protein